MIGEEIELFGLSPESVLRLVSFGELTNGLDMSLSDTASFIVPVAASLFVTAVIPSYKIVVGWERLPNVSMSPDSGY